MTATAGAATDADRRGPRRFAVRRSVLAWAGGLLLAAAALFTLYLRQSLVAPFNADGASIMLQAQAMHGNLLLKGWWIADVSFYTTELPEYMIVTALRGLRPDVVHICGALTYTLTVLLAAMLARGQAKGREGLVRALVAGAIMLAPSVLGGTEVFLQEPNHAGTAVPILALFLLLDRASPEDPGRGYARWWVPPVACVVLAAVQIGDQLGLVAATAPIAGVAAARLAMLALRRRPLREYWYDAALLAAAAASYELANVSLRAIRKFGGYYPAPLPKQLIAPTSQLRGNLHVMLQSIQLLFGASYQGRHPQLNLSAELHWVGLGLAAAGLAVAVVTFFPSRTFPSRTDRVSQILAAATICTLFAGVFGTLIQSLSYAHEVAILLPLGAVLAGRMLPPLLPARWWDTSSEQRSSRPATVVFSLLGIWLAAGLAALCFAASWAPLAPPQQQLATWLAGHHYTAGLAGYWQANSTTVVTGGQVLVAPVTPESLDVRHWESSSAWYDPAQSSADFVIAASDPSVPPGGLSIPTVRKRFGQPAREYTVGPYVVMVYDYNLLTRLGGRAFPGVPGTG
ncbi:MAG: hypothetical protein WAK28_16555 [Trebonia sp.]